MYTLYRHSPIFAVMQFWWLFLLFFFPFIGGVFGLLVQSEKTRQLKLFLAFSGAFLISITILNLIPEVYEKVGHKAGYYILAGFFLQIVLDFFTKGIEHGHLHFHEFKKGFPYSVFIALSLHAFIEGLGLGGGAFSHSIPNNMVFAIGYVSRLIACWLSRYTHCPYRVSHWCVFAHKHHYFI
jgi:zinc transporter ZupT